MAFLSFSVHRKVSDNFETVGVLYDFPNGGESRAFIEEIDRLFNRRLPPSRLVIVCQDGRQDAIATEFQSVKSLAEPRLRVAEDVQVLPYGESGRLLDGKIAILRGGANHWKVTDSDLGEIAEAGMIEFIRQNGVILDAPLGYEFRKPSQDSSPVFVRAGNLIRELPILALTNHLLMRRFAPNMEVVFIDSFTILSIALAFQQARKDQRASGQDGVVIPRIENFRSYSIKDDFLFPVGIEYGVLISASTSGNLASKLVERHGAIRSRITHLIGYSSDPALAKECLVFRREEPKPRGEEFQFLKEISIRGEEFLAAHSKPLPVQITKSHFCPRLGEILAEEWYGGALAVRLAAAGHGAYCTFSMDGCESLGGSTFADWIRGECEYSLPSNIGWILAADDNRGLNLAKRLQRRLKGLLGKTVPVRRLSILDRSSRDPSSSKDETVVVCCSESGWGDELLAASRFLRSVRLAHRHYLCAYFFPESRERLERLERNLCISGSGRDYGFSAFISEPVGKFAIHDSWSHEQSLLERGFAAGTQASLQPKLRSIIVRRRQTLASGVVTGNALFLPALNGTELELRPDSVLFPKGYKRIAQTVVYYRVACGLQCARDHKTSKGKKLEASLCFHGNPFVASILDPDMFSRYNDGVIQAALLRCCTSDEMNFAVDQEASAQMRDIISELIRHRLRKSGEAILEFLLALRTRKIRLVECDYQLIVSQIDSVADLNAFWTLLNAEAEL